MLIFVTILVSIVLCSLLFLLIMDKVRLELINKSKVITIQNKIILDYNILLKEIFDDNVPKCTTDELLSQAVEKVHRWRDKEC